MAELMEEHDDREHEQEGDDVADEPMAQRIETIQKKVRHPVPLDEGRRPLPQSSRMPLRQFEAIGRQPYFSQYGQWKSRRPPRSAAPDSRCESSRSASPRPSARYRRI